MPHQYLGNGVLPDVIDKHHCVFVVLPQNPAGWEDIRNGNRYDGGQSVIVAVDLEAIPVFRRLR